MTTAIVIGAGVFGAWSALELSLAGHRVTLLDAYGPGNGRASSADHSRVLRAGYGADAIYSEWAVRSRERWLWLARESAASLFTTIGAVFMGEPGHEYIRRTYDTLSAIGVVAEWLEPSEIARRWPPIAIEGLGPAVFERDAGALRARAAVLATVRHAVAQHSVEYRTAAIKPFDEARGDVVLETLDGIRLEADAYVVAGGPWLPRLFPQAVGGRIRATRQEVLYFGTPPSDDRYASTSLPIWIDFGAGLYGIPDLDGHGFKVGIDAHGPSIDPDTADRIVDPHIVASTARWLPSRFPGLAGAPLIDARVCQYESTSSGDFLIDRHPAWPNLLIVGGGSGHGFKHGPAVGRYVADLLDGRTAPEPRFALEGKATLAQRAVF